MPWGLEVWRAFAEGQTAWRDRLMDLQAYYLDREPSGRALVEFALEDPLGVLPDVLRAKVHQVKREATVDRVIERLRQGWDGWSARQQIAYLGGLLVAVEAHRDARAHEFLRAALTDSRTQSEVKPVILDALQGAKALRIEDVQAVYDLADPQVAAAQLGRVNVLPRTRLVYDAFASLRAHPDPQWRDAYYDQFPPGIAAADMLLDTEVSIRLEGVSRLAGLRSGTDVAHFIRFLADPDHRVRTQAAQALALAYDRAAIQALANALDDPSPDVRQAARASLENIEQFEAQKKRWKEFAEKAR
jgi:hypothetical protein